MVNMMKIVSLCHISTGHANCMRKKIIDPIMPIQVIKFDRKTFEPSCGSEFPINSQNSDANCHRKRPSYALKLLKKSQDLCLTCVYNEEN